MKDSEFYKLFFEKFKKAVGFHAQSLVFDPNISTPDIQFVKTDIGNSDNPQYRVGTKIIIDGVLCITHSTVHKDLATAEDDFFRTFAHQVFCMALNESQLSTQRAAADYKKKTGNNT